MGGVRGRGSVLECGAAAPLFPHEGIPHGGIAHRNAKRRRCGALQNLAEFPASSVVAVAFWSAALTEPALREAKERLR
jgi:hypothetical protein